MNNITKQLLVEAVKNTNEPLNLSLLAKSIGITEEEALLILTSQEKEPLKPTQFKDPGIYICLGCVHAPAENKAMMRGVTNLMRDLGDKVRGLVLLGDFIDCNTLSEYDKGRFPVIKNLTIQEEYEAGSRLLDNLTSYLHPDAHKIYLYGNHEDRYNRYMANMQLAKTPIPSPAEGMNLYDRGFHVYSRWKHDYVKLGDHLECMHGQFISTHCAKKHIDNYRGSVLFAHTHRIQTYIEGSVGGFNIGWCGDVDSPFFDYMERGTKMQWQNGFALVTVDPEGDFHVNQITCHNNKFYYNGIRYE